MDTANGIKHERTFPRAVVHKRILSVAESRPDASMETIAEAVSGATTSLVEQVLDEYGDPGGQSADGAPSTTDDARSPSAGDRDPVGEADRDPTGEAAHDSRGVEDRHSTPATSAMTDHDDSTDAPLPEPADVTEKQLETLRAIRDDPTATQATLADRLGVRSATISQRVNGIDGFDWSTRRSFVERFFDQDGIAPPDDASRAAADRETGADSDEDTITGANSDEGTVTGVDSETASRQDPDDPPSDGTASDESGSSVGSETERSGADASLENDGDNAADAGEHGRGVSAAADSSPTTAAASTPAARADGAPAGPAGDADDATGADRNGDAGDGQPADRGAASAALADRVAELAARVDALERDRAPGRSVLADPELAHKVVHACFSSDQISADEELRILEGLLECGDRAGTSAPSSRREEH